MNAGPTEVRAARPKRPRLSYSAPGGRQSSPHPLRALVRRIAAWYAMHRRELPWRTTPPTPRDPYRSLVSELMLQQTQVSRVVERFQAFVDRFPTVRDLAAAEDADVLAMWSGLGYYRRARHLHAAARAIVERFGGVVPSDAADLRTLPGVGRYTAGAIASIVFNRPEPIVDGNVARVLLRIEGRELTAQQGADWAWARAETLVRIAADLPSPMPVAPAAGPALFNEGLMELGAMVCLPRSPRCEACPVHAHCRAFASGSQGRIPRPKLPPARKPMFCAAVIIRDARDRLLVERRGDTGMWAGLWQVPTLETPRRATRRAVETWIGGPVRHLDRFEHGATHRDVRFDVWIARAVPRHPPLRDAAYKTLRQVGSLGISNAMRRVLLAAPAARPDRPRSVAP